MLQTRGEPAVRGSSASTPAGFAARGAPVAGPRLATLQPPRPATPLAPAAPLGAAGAAARQCANCGTSTLGAYCFACGQEQHDFHRSLRTVIAELLDAFAGWDGKLVATFRTLLLHPGALTQEFLAGRRMRYLRPLRVYLTASVLFFLAMRTPVPGAFLVSAPVVTAEQAADDSATVRHFSTPVRHEGRLWRAVRERMLAWVRVPYVERERRLNDLFLGHLGTTVFLLVPVLAALTQRLWRGVGLCYAEHLVFALHAHAAGMLGLAVVHLAPKALAVVPGLWLAGYVGMAARRVFGAGRERWRRTSAKLAAVAVTYGLALALGLLVTLGVSVLGGDLPTTTSTVGPAVAPKPGPPAPEAPGA